MSNYDVIKSYYEASFDEHGDTPEGLAWQDHASMQKRFEVMAGLMLPPAWPEPYRLLDLGCGTGEFFSYLNPDGIRRNKDLFVIYSGIDISSKMIDHCKSKFSDALSAKRGFIFNDKYYKISPVWRLENFYHRDIIKEPLEPKAYDYIVMNGILTVKDSLSFDDMWNFTQQLLKTAYDSAAKGIAFNVMSKQVDWEREDLFHLPLDTMAEFVTKNLSRNFVIRNDYGLYEYTVYVYRDSI